MSARHLAISAGGTGGHMFPAQALAETMLARGWRVTLMTDGRGAHYADGFPDRVVVQKIASATFARGGAPTKLLAPFAIAAGIASNLLVRAADVTLKERRPLILAVRESPLHLGHLRTMVSLTEMGAVIAPPLPAFYTKPEIVDDLVDHSVNRILDLLGLPPGDAHRWDGV